MARRRTFGPVRGSKRHSSWTGSIPLTAFTALAASSVALTQVFTPFDGGETAVRTRGLFGWQSDQRAVAEDQMGAVGIGVVTEQAATLGVTAVPAPDTDSGWSGWLWHSYFASGFEIATAVGFEPDMLHRIQIDSKAMRKVGDNERLVVVVQNSSTVGIQIFDSIRILSKPF